MKVPQSPKLGVSGCAGILCAIVLNGLLIVSLSVIFIHFWRHS